MIRKCYSCGNTFILIEHGKTHYHYYPNTYNYCPGCGRGNTKELKIEELKAILKSYKSATYEHEYDIKKLEYIVEAEEMLETSRKLGE